MEKLEGFALEDYFRLHHSPTRPNGTPYSGNGKLEKRDISASDDCAERCALAEPTITCETESTSFDKAPPLWSDEHEEQTEAAFFEGYSSLSSFHLHALREVFISFLDLAPNSGEVYDRDAWLRLHVPIRKFWVHKTAYHMQSIPNPAEGHGGTAWLLSRVDGNGAVVFPPWHETVTAGGIIRQVKYKSRRIFDTFWDVASFFFKKHRKFIAGNPLVVSSFGPVFNIQNRWTIKTEDLTNMNDDLYTKK